MRRLMLIGATCVACSGEANAPEESEMAPQGSEMTEPEAATSDSTATTAATTPNQPSPYTVPFCESADYCAQPYEYSGVRFFGYAVSMDLTQNTPPNTARNLVGSATFRIGDDSCLYAEAEVGMNPPETIVMMQFGDVLETHWLIDLLRRGESPRGALSSRSEPADDVVAAVLAACPEATAVDAVFTYGLDHPTHGSSDHHMPDDYVPESE